MTPSEHYCSQNTTTIKTLVESVFVPSGRMLEIKFHRAYTLKTKVLFYVHKRSIFIREVCVSHCINVNAGRTVPLFNFILKNYIVKTFLSIFSNLVLSRVNDQKHLLNLYHL